LPIHFDAITGLNAALIAIHYGWAVVSASRLQDWMAMGDIGVSWYCCLSQLPLRLTQIEFDVKAPVNLDVRSMQNARRTDVNFFWIFFRAS
jgi:hypothetical protein